MQNPFVVRPITIWKADGGVALESEG